MNKQKQLIHYTKKHFSQITLQTNQSTVSFNTSQSKVNWSLARLYINPRNKVSVDQFTAGKGETSESVTPVIKTIKDLGNIKFNNYLRKMGKIVSLSEEIYVQNGKLGNANIRVVSNEKDTMKSVVGAIESNDSVADSIDILVVTQGELKVNPFILYDKDSRIILTNSKDMSNIGNLINQSI